MTNDKCREEFEAYVTSDAGGYLPEHLERDADGEYTIVWEYWEVWKASRASLVVELPAKSDPIYWYEDESVEGQSFDYPLYIKHVKAAIESTGVKTE